MKEHELRRLAVLVVDEFERRALVANANHSGGPSATGIAAPVGEDRCDITKEPESMDPMNTRIDGESTSLKRAEEDARRDIAAIRRSQKQKPTSTLLVSRRKASR